MVHDLNGGFVHKSDPICALSIVTQYRTSENQTSRLILDGHHT